MVTYSIERLRQAGVCLNPDGSVTFDGTLYDAITHFHPQHLWRRCRTYWQETGWVIGYRDFIPSDITPANGFGGQLMIVLDKDQGVCSIDPTMVVYLS